jgi:4-hydroxy-tetrahydrodipicolinate synthase
MGGRGQVHMVGDDRSFGGTVGGELVVMPRIGVGGVAPDITVYSIRNPLRGVGVAAPITGSFVAVVTPMNEDGTIDYLGFRDLLDFHRRHGTSAVLIMGSSGEVSMLAPEERRRIVEETAADKRPELPQWYGCTGPTTEATIDYVRHAAAAGADGAIIAAPPYICASRQAITQFFLEVADASPIPIGIYNNPPRVKTDLHTEDLLRIAAHPNVAVHKESTGRVGQVAEMLRARPDGLSIMCCCSPDLGLVVPTMALGGHGTANMTGNILPREMAALSRPWVDDDGQAGVFRETYLRILPMMQFVYSQVNPVPVKSFMRAVGLPAGPLRRPLQPLSPEELSRGLRTARELELDRTYGYALEGMALQA